MNLPPPRATLAGCMWLPRILQKGRLLEAGALPADYAERLPIALATTYRHLDASLLTSVFQAQEADEKVL